MRSVSATMIAVMVGPLVAAGGCAGERPVRAYHVQSLHEEQFTTNSPLLVLGAPAQIAERLNSGELAEAPWWASRNDPRLNVAGGEPRGQITDYVISIDNRQRSFGDRHHDIHRRSAASATYGRIVR